VFIGSMFSDVSEELTVFVFKAAEEQNVAVFRFSMFDYIK
jgi:hypothetical protein